MTQKKERKLKSVNNLFLWRNERLFPTLIREMNCLYAIFAKNALKKLIQGHSRSKFSKMVWIRQIKTTWYSQRPPWESSIVDQNSNKLIFFSRICEKVTMQFCKQLWTGLIPTCRCHVVCPKKWCRYRYYLQIIKTTSFWKFIQKCR